VLVAARAAAAAAAAAAGGEAGTGGEAGATATAAAAAVEAGVGKISCGGKPIMEFKEVAAAAAVPGIDDALPALDDLIAIGGDVGTAAGARPSLGRGSHSFTFVLNVSTFCGIR